MLNGSSCLCEVRASGGFRPWDGAAARRLKPQGAGATVEGPFKGGGRRKRATRRTRRSGPASLLGGSAWLSGGFFFVLWLCCAPTALICREDEFTDFVNRWSLCRFFSGEALCQVRAALCASPRCFSCSMGAPQGSNIALTAVLREAESAYRAAPIRAVSSSPESPPVALRCGLSGADFRGQKTRPIARAQNRDIPRPSSVLAPYMSTRERKY